MKLKALWYCTKSDLKLYKTRDNDYTTMKAKDNIFGYEELNGKIVAISDYEVEEVTYVDNVFKENYHTKTLDFNELIKRSRLTIDDLVKYLGMGDFIEKIGYAIHIKNLHIFDRAKGLYEYYPTNNSNPIPNEFVATYVDAYGLKKAPRNMCYAYDKDGNKYVVISVRPEWLCLILNELKDVEVRRKVLKEMI